ncbi:MAG: hypothetical protein ACU0B1_03795 [Thermohalobaculum sp.]
MDYVPTINRSWEPIDAATAGFDPDKLAAVIAYAETHETSWPYDLEDAGGLSVGGEFSGGCADSGFAAAVSAPTICGTGPVGGKAHSPEEFLELNSIVPRAQALALTVLRLT